MPEGKKEQPSRNQLVVAIISILLVGIVWVVFGQTLGHEFVNYDDDQYVYENPTIANGLTLDGIGWAFTHAHASNWHPLTTISHMLDCQLYGLRPWGHHLTNVLLHAAAAVFLFLALRELTKTDWPSGFVAAVFAIHPLHVSSVAWVAERKDVLSGLFFMLTLWAYARYARAERSSRRAYIAAVVFFALGLMSKPTVVTLPFVLLLLDYWPLRRFGEENGFGLELSLGRVGQLVVEKIPFFVLSAGSVVATLLAQESAVMTIRQLSLGERIGNGMVSYVTYLSQMFWPAGLAVFYPYPPGHVNVGQAVFASLLLVVISVSFFLWRRVLPFLWVGWLWFLGMLVPMIGLIQVGEQARADRYTYLTEIGLYILVAWGAMKLVGGWNRGREALAVLAIVIVVGLTGASYAQTSCWKDSESLWNETLAHTTNNYIAHNNLAKALMLKGRLDDAVYHFQKALELCSNCPEVNNNLGHVLARKGAWAEAVTAYRAAIRDWGKPNAHNNNNLGISLAKTGKTEEAIEQFREALRIDPDYREAHSNLALLLLQLDRRDEAIIQFKEVLRLKPDDEQTKAQLRQLGVEN